MYQDLDHYALTGAIFALIVVIGFPGLRRAWREGQVDGKRILEDVEGKSTIEQARIYWRYAGPGVAMLATYFAIEWFRDG